VSGDVDSCPIRERHDAIGADFAGSLPVPLSASPLRSEAEIARFLVTWTGDRAMSYRTTMTGSWFRTKDLVPLFAQSPTGELGTEHEKAYLAAERAAIRDQLHPMGSTIGLDEVSNGEQRLAGYTSFLPNRFEGFSPTERVPMPFSPELIAEFTESNPALAAQMGTMAPLFALPKIVAPLKYTGAERAAREAKDAVQIAKEEGASSIFQPSPSPGVITIFYPNNPKVYPDHQRYLDALTAELHKEYAAILAVPGITLQIDAPDLAMGKQTATDWGLDFYEALPHHVDAINEAVQGLPKDRIRVHYCYGNYAASHVSDADFSKVLPELARLKVSRIVGELANPHHQGDVRILARYVKENGWPNGLGFVGGVIDVKTPIVETPDTVRLRLEQVGNAVGHSNAWGGTDCGFETFAAVQSITHAVGLRKLRALAEGARLGG
jgi:5-methyltetrahydropteroyltriglutamate--homocysteine methyltransferase